MIICSHVNQKPVHSCTAYAMYRCSPSKLCLNFCVGSEVPVVLSCLHTSCDTWQRCQSEAFSLVHSICDSQMPSPSYSWSLFVESEVPVMLGCLDSSCDKLQPCQSEARSLLRSICDYQMPFPSYAEFCSCRFRSACHAHTCLDSNCGNF